MPRSIRDIAVTLLLIGVALLILFSVAPPSETGLAGRMVYAAVRPFQEGISSIRDRVKGVWESYLYLVGLREENRLLKNQIQRLTQERTGLLGAETENRRLRKLLSFGARHEFPTLAAQVIGEDALGWYRTIFINRGTDDGVKPEMPVVVAEGVVGRVAKGSAGVSRVLLLTDPNLSVDCRIVRTRDRGVLTGSLEGVCILRYLGLKSEVRPGDEVVTSGLDAVFPKGLLVGRVESVKKTDQGLFLEAKVQPAVRFSELEEVLVVLGREGGFDIRTGLEESR
jgi:rod shape-determining protein MreC